MVTRTLRVTGCRRSLVGVVAFVAARLAMMPGVGFWDTAELQAVGPSSARPIRPASRPTSCSAGSPTVVLTPFGEPAFRMNLFAGCACRGRRGRDRRPGTGPYGPGPRRDGWSSVSPSRASSGSSARMPTPMPCTWRSWPSCSGSSSPGRTAGATAARRGGGRIRARGRQPFADLAARAADHPLRRSPSTADILRRPRYGPRLLRSALLTSALVYLELPLRAGPFRPPARLRPPGDVGRLLVHRARRAVPRQPRRSVRRPRARPRPGRPHGDAFGPCRCAPALGVRDHRRPTAALRAADRVRGGDHVLLRRVVRQRHDRPLLPRSRC